MPKWADASVVIKNSIIPVKRVKEIFLLNAFSPFYIISAPDFCRKTRIGRGSRPLSFPGLDIEDDTHDTDYITYAPDDVGNPGTLFFLEPGKTL